MVQFFPIIKVSYLLAAFARIEMEPKFPVLEVRLKKDQVEPLEQYPRPFALDVISDRRVAVCYQFADRNLEDARHKRVARPAARDLVSVVG